MFSERLERLIDAALQDGMLSDQEKAAIIKRAQAEGEDIDEVDIYIQSLQQKRQQELNEQAQKAQTEEMLAQKKSREAASKARQEEEKERAKLLRKCPACGEPIPFGTITCPKCGQVIELDEKNKAIIQLMEDVEICKPQRCHFGKLDLRKVIEIKDYNNNNDLQKAYRVTGTHLTAYECESRYNELISELTLKYSGVPQVEDYLRMERIRCYQLRLDDLEDMLRHDQKGRIGNVKCMIKQYDLIQSQYPDLIDEAHMSALHEGILEVKEKYLKQEEAEKRKQQTITYKMSEYFDDREHQAWAIVVFVAFVLLIMSFVISWWILIGFAAWVAASPIIKDKLWYAL